MPDGSTARRLRHRVLWVLANVFYTGGWISDQVMRAVTTTEKASAFGLKAFRTGVFFSILLTLCPALVCWIVFSVALWKGQKHGPPRG